MARLTAALSASTTPTATARTARLAVQRLILAAEKKRIEMELKDVDARLLAHLKSEGEADREGKLRLETDDAKLLLITGESVSLDERLLLDLGVRPRIIAKAKRRTPYEYAKVTAKADTE